MLQPLQVGTIDNLDDSLAITVNDFGGHYDFDNTDYFLSGTAETLWSRLIVDGVNGADYKVAYRWMYDDFTGGDPSLLFSSFTSQWIVEGCATTHVSGKCGNITTNAVPVPTAVWLFGSGLAGLSAAARRRKNKI